MYQFDDGSEVHEAQRRRVELVEPLEELPAALVSPEQPFNLVPELVGFPVVVPFDFQVRPRRHDRRHPDLLDEAASLVALIGAVHNLQRVRNRIGPVPSRAQPLSPSCAFPPGRQKIIACRLLSETM